MADAVDFSFWTAIPTPEQVQCWKASGVRRAIIGTRGNRRDFAKQARVCMDGGLAVHAYVYLRWDEPGLTQGMNARALIVTVPGIRCVWLDVEADDKNPVEGDPRATLAAARHALPDYQLGIYTSQTMWAEIMHDSAAHKDLPLWDASYGSPHTAFYAYGGWTQRAMHQYAGSVDLCGLNVDLNTIGGGRMYSDADIDAKVGAVLMQLGELGAEKDRIENDVTALKGFLAKVIPALAKEQDADVLALLKALGGD